MHGSIVCAARRGAQLSAFSRPAAMAGVSGRQSTTRPAPVWAPAARRDCRCEHPTPPSALLARGGGGGASTKGQVERVITAQLSTGGGDIGTKGIRDGCGGFRMLRSRSGAVFLAGATPGLLRFRASSLLRLRCSQKRRSDKGGAPKITRRAPFRRPHVCIAGVGGPPHPTPPDCAIRPGQVLQLCDRRCGCEHG